jgi:hypothetical protein
MLAAYGDSAPGSAAWLIGTELRFGGRQTNITRRKISDLDSRSLEELEKGEGMKGGDRMLHHGYGEIYAEFLEPFVGLARKLTLLEFGILRGTGLATWCELFPSARVVGLDIDPSHFEDNLPSLEKLGAFRRNRPEVYPYDQLVPADGAVRDIVGGEGIDICMDDGLHSVESILVTMESVRPFLSKNFVYFVEDNDEVHSEMRERYPDWRVDNFGQMTVVRPSA